MLEERSLSDLLGSASILVLYARADQDGLSWEGNRAEQSRTTDRAIYILTTRSIPIPNML